MQTENQSIVTPDMLMVHDCTDNQWKPLVREPWSFYQREFDRNVGPKNIVWKRRQIGMTTWCLARGFLALTKQKNCLYVFNNVEMAEHAYDLSMGFLEQLREDVKSCLPLGDAQFISSQSELLSRPKGRMWDYVLFSEFSHWRPDTQRYAMRAVRPTLAKGSEFTIESTPGDNEHDLFHDIFRGANKLGWNRHYFPWWKDPRFVDEPVPVESLSREERQFMVLHPDISMEQMGWRRKKTTEFTNLYGDLNMFKVDWGESCDV